MRRVLQSSFCLLWSGLLLGLASGEVFADDEGGKEAAHKENIYKASFEEKDQKKEKKFDLNKPADRKELASLIQQNKVEHLEHEEPVDIFDLRWELGLWTIVIFVLLLLILNKVAWKPMLEGLQKREQNIHNDLAEAKAAREEAQRIKGELQQELNKANDKIRDLIEAARHDAERMTSDMVSKARAEIQTERERLRREIETARDQALQELWTQTAQLATLISAKAIRRQLTEDDHRQLVDEALAELHEAGSKWQQQG